MTVAVRGRATRVPRSAVEPVPIVERRVGAQRRGWSAGGGRARDLRVGRASDRRVARDRRRVRPDRAARADRRGLRPRLRRTSSADRRGSRGRWTTRPRRPRDAAGSSSTRWSARSGSRPGSRLDLGGIGKGRAADLLALELLDRGATGVLVDLGGDLRVAGEAPEVAPRAVVSVCPVVRGARLGGGHRRSARHRRDRSAHARRGRDRDELTPAPAVDTRRTADAPPRRSPHRGAGDHRSRLGDGARRVGQSCRSGGESRVRARRGRWRSARRALGVTGVLVHDDGRVEDLPGVAAFRV